MGWDGQKLTEGGMIFSRGGLVGVYVRKNDVEINIYN